MYDDLYQLYSDLFKDAFGWRPRTTVPLTESELRQAIKNVQAEMDYMAEEQEFQALLEQEASRLKSMYVDNIIPGENV